MRKFLVIRLSAFGDVAMSVPVIRAVCTQNKDIHLCLLSRKHFQPLFKGIPNLSFIEPDLYGKHKGVAGLYKLYREASEKNRFEAVIDLHDVLRSRMLSTFSRLSGKKVHRIDKGRKEKKALINQGKRLLKPLKHTTERYGDVFRKAGLDVDLRLLKPQKNVFEPSEQLKKITGGSEIEKKWIGIAPFAFHAEKMYPLEKMKEVIARLNQENVRIFLFGGGEEEKKAALEISSSHDGVTTIIGRLDLNDELALMAQINVMLTMDSANMHLAALVGTKVISIWGATHPFAGFTAFGQHEPKNLIQIPTEQLNCRPCSIFGNKACFRKDLACLNWIAPETIYKRVLDELGLENCD